MKSPLIRSHCPTCGKVWRRPIKPKAPHVPAHGTIARYKGHRCSCARCLKAWRTYIQTRRANASLAGGPQMRVLIACEFSGRVRQAFREKGHDAWSCDLLPAEDGSRYHHQADIFELLDDPITSGGRRSWDLMIAHPPCTYLCNSGVRWLYNSDGTRNLERWAHMDAAARFFGFLLTSGIPRIAIENPIMSGHASVLYDIGKPTQIVHPWQFGHGETKATGLWLRGLPPLTPTRMVSGRVPRVHHASPGPDRWKERSRTYSGIARAMADQWGHTKQTT